MKLERGSISPERAALTERVKHLRENEGLKYSEIAQLLGISRSYASCLYTDPDGSKALTRKDSHHGTCVDCGNPTSGSGGRDAAPERCVPCARTLATAHRKWTREAVIDAILRFNSINGRPPLSDDWITADPDNGYPPRSSVYVSSSKSASPFKSWADAIEAAGFPRPKVGRYVRRPRGTPAPRKEVHTIHGRKAMREYIILELDSDGRWIEHPLIQSYSEALAIEKFIETLGDLNGRAVSKFVAVSKARWIVRELKQVMTFKAVVSA